MMAQTKTVITTNGEKVTINPFVNNGLTANNGFIQLGGALTKPSVLTTTSAFTLAFQGLQAGTASDNVLVTDANGILKYVPRTSFSGADNLGNHIATQNLDMASKNIINIFNAYIKNDLQIFDRTASNTTYFGIYKNNGLFGIWNNSKNTNALTIDETTNKTTLNSVQIAKGTNGIAPVKGDIATSADTNGNIVWTKPQDFGNIIYTTAAVAPGESYVVDLQIDPSYSNFTITSMNGCTIPMILNIATFGDGMAYVGGSAGNGIYSATSLSSYARKFKFTATTLGCQDGGNSTEFDLTITKYPGKLTITNNGNIPRTYQIRQKIN